MLLSIRKINVLANIDATIAIANGYPNTQQIKIGVVIAHISTGINIVLTRVLTFFLLFGVSALSIR